MTNDFYCDEALSGKTPVDVVAETAEVLAFHHTRPYWPVHIVVVPKQHVPPLADPGTAEHGAARVLTNLGAYQDSKHLHFHVSSGAPLVS